MKRVELIRGIVRVINKYCLSNTLRKYHSQVFQSDMKDKIICLAKEKDLTNAIRLAVDCLQTGGVIALPTDTIYGLAGLTQMDEAVNKIYDIKARNTLKPIAVSVSQVEEIYKWANVCVTKKLLDELLPGPVTVVFERKTTLNTRFNPQTSLLGLRVPDDEFIRGVCSQLSSPIALTSANVSNHESALKIEEFSTLWPSIDLIFDNGPITFNNLSKSGSTIVNLSEEGYYSIVRDGCALEDTVTKLKKYGLTEKL